VSQAFRHWLPDNAAAPALLQGAIGDLVEAWSVAWFAREPVRLLGGLARLRETRAELRRTGWHVCDGGLAIGVPASGLTTIGSHVMGLAPAGPGRTAEDLALLERLGGACLDDLQRRAASVLRMPAGSRWTVVDTGLGGTVHRAEIATPSRSLALTIELGDQRFVQLVKDRLPPAAPAGPLGDAAAALAPLQVLLSANVGRCSITVAELSGLARGDVLVLDRDTGAPLPLAVDGTRASRGACTVMTDDDALALKITQALAG
jgi:flagellar motor switch/type III secretory pathway protein FliN